MPTFDLCQRFSQWCWYRHNQTHQHTNRQHKQGMVTFVKSKINNLIISFYLCATKVICSRLNHSVFNCLYGRLANRLQISLSPRYFLSSIPGPVKSNTVADTSSPPRRFCVVHPVSRGDGPRHSLCASA